MCYECECCGKIVSANKMFEYKGKCKECFKLGKTIKVKCRKD